MVLCSLFMTQPNNTQKKLENSVMLLMGHNKHVTKVYAKKLSREVVQITSKKENAWMDPYILMGLAINESDLKWWIKTGRGSSLDCGITQNHVPLFRKTYAGRIKLCERLRRFTKLSFKYAMLELNTIKRKWCAKNINKVRCVLNVYNQGPRFLWRKNCWLKRKKNETYKKYIRRIYRCKYRNRYWIRSMCFTTGLWLGRKPKITCRRALSIRWVKKVYGTKIIKPTLEF